MCKYWFRCIFSVKSTVIYIAKMLLPALPKACIWEHFWVAHSLFSLLSASDCQCMLLKQTSYFKRQFLFSVFVSLAVFWEGGRNSKRIKVDSGPMNKEKKCNDKTVHLPELHSFSQDDTISGFIWGRVSWASRSHQLCSIWILWPRLHKLTGSLHFHSSFQNGAVMRPAFPAVTCPSWHTALHNHNRTEEQPQAHTYSVLQLVWRLLVLSFVQNFWYSLLQYISASLL